MRAKLGIPGADAGQADALVADLLGQMSQSRVDHTSFYRRLASAARGDSEPARGEFVDLAAFDAWLARWRELGPDPAAMDAVNPIYIPRNHLVEEALDGAVAGDLAPLHALVDVLRNPYEVRPNLERYALPGPGGGFVTFCGT
jgi:uncharacterized protein YdiU (UPF0061 family)